MSLLLKKEKQTDKQNKKGANKNMIIVHVTDIDIEIIKKILEEGILPNGDNKTWVSVYTRIEDVNVLHDGIGLEVDVPIEDIRTVKDTRNKESRTNSYVMGAIPSNKIKRIIFKRQVTPIKKGEDPARCKEIGDISIEINLDDLNSLCARHNRSLWEWKDGKLIRYKSQ